MIKTLCTTIDEATSGGIEKGVMTEICGESSSGKTTLCLQLAVSAASSTAHEMVSAIYISANSAFQIQRLHEIAVGQFGVDEGQKIMKKVLVIECFEANDMRDVLTSVDMYIKSNISSSTPIQLLVVDSICSLFYNTFPPTQFGRDERSMLLRAVSFCLKNIEAKHNIAVVACNGAVNSYNSNDANNFTSSGRILKPRLVWNFQMYTATRLLLMKDCEEGNGMIRTLEERFCNRASNFCLFRITKNGIENFNEINA